MQITKRGWSFTLQKNQRQGKVMSGADRVVFSHRSSNTTQYYFLPLMGLRNTSNGAFFEHVLGTSKDSKMPL